MRKALQSAGRPVRFRPVVLVKRNHPLLELDNVIIAPHLGSATVETRQRMAEISVENLLAGLEGRPLVHEVQVASAGAGTGARV